MQVKSLAGRTILGFTQLAVFLGAALFAPAWTLNFWQGRVYLSIFTSASALIAAYLWKYDRTLLESRVKAGPSAEKEKSQKLIQLLASLAFIGTLVLPSLDCRYHWSHVPSVFVIVGDAVVALGFLAVFIVYRENTPSPQRRLKWPRTNESSPPVPTRSFAIQCMPVHWSCSSVHRLLLERGGDW
jgi:hypothetical protein